MENGILTLSSPGNLLERVLYISISILCRNSTSETQM